MALLGLYDGILNKLLSACEIARNAEQPLPQTAGDSPLLKFCREGTEESSCQITIQRPKAAHQTDAGKAGLPHQQDLCWNSPHHQVALGVSGPIEDLTMDSGNHQQTQLILYDLCRFAFKYLKVSQKPELKILVNEKLIISLFDFKRQPDHQRVENFLVSAYLFMHLIRVPGDRLMTVFEDANSSLCIQIGDGPRSSIRKLTFDCSTETDESFEQQFLKTLSEGGSPLYICLFFNELKTCSWYLNEKGKDKQHDRLPNHDTSLIKLEGDGSKLNISVTAFDSVEDKYSSFQMELSADAAFSPDRFGDDKLLSTVVRLVRKVVVEQKPANLCLVCLTVPCRTAIKWLDIASGRETSCCTEEGQTVPSSEDAHLSIFHSAASGDVAVLRQRLEYNPLLVSAQQQEFPHRTALLCAAAADLEDFSEGQKSHTECASLLINKGADVRDCDSRGHSVLQCAVLSDNEKLVEFLLKNSTADPNSRDEDGQTPLQLAVEQENVAITKLFLESGMEVCLNTDGTIVELVQAIDSENFELVRTLLNHCPEAMSDDQFHKYYWQAWKLDATQICSLLLISKYDLSDETVREATQLGQFASQGDVEQLKLKLSIHNCNLRDWDCRTPLMWAAIASCDPTEGHADCAELLLSLGAKPNAADLDGNSSLHLAAASNNLEVAALLLLHGADEKARNRKGASPAELAKQSGQPDVQCILETSVELEIRQEMSFNSGGGCEHPFKKLRKKCLSAGCQELIALGDPRCTACSTEDPFDYSCGICGDAAMCDHSNEKCQKTCKNCKTPAKSLGSKFCSECGKQRTFEVACSCQIGSESSSVTSAAAPTGTQSRDATPTNNSAPQSTVTTEVERTESKPEAQQEAPATAKTGADLPIDVSNLSFSLVNPSLTKKPPPDRIDNSTQEKSLPYAPEPGQPTKFEIEMQPRMSQDLTTNQPANQRKSSRKKKRAPQPKPAEQTKEATSIPTADSSKKASNFYDPASEEANNHSSLLPSVKDSGPVNRGTKAIDTDEVKPDEVPEKNSRPTDYLKLVKKEYPNEPLLEVILNCYLDNGSFEFDPGTDRVLIVFKKHELGNDNPAKSPFVFKQECLIDQNHQNTGLSYWRSSFLLPKKLLKDGLEYRYAVEKSSTSTCQEEAGIRLMKHDGTQQHLLQLDALVTSPTPSKTPSRSMDDEYKLQLRLLVDSALDELKRLPPKTVLKAAQARLNDPKLRRKDFQQERMKQEEMERLLSGLCESPDDFGFSTDENRSWEKWLRNIDLFIFLVFNGAITGSANLASGIQQNNLKILLKLILPPIDWKRQTEIARETIADFEEALKIVGEGDVNLLEYLYVAPAYHILLLNVKPWGSDGIDEVYSQIPSITDRNWWGLHRLTDNFCHQIKRLRYNLVWLDSFLSKYGRVDPLLGRLCAALTRDDALPELLKLRHLSLEVKLAVAACILQSKIPMHQTGHFEQIIAILDELSGNTLLVTSPRAFLFIGFELANAVLRMPLRSVRMEALAVGLSFKSVRFVLMRYLTASQRDGQKGREMLSENEKRRAKDELEKLLQALVDYHCEFLKRNAVTVTVLLEQFNALLILPLDYQDGKLHKGILSILSSGLQLLLDQISTEALLELFSERSVEIFSTLSANITKSAIELLFSRLESMEQGRYFFEQMSTTWKGLRRIFREDHPHFSIACQALSNAVISLRSNRIGRFQGTHKADPNLTLVLEWPLAAMVIADMKRGSKQFQKLSEEALAIMKTCSSTGSNLVERIAAGPGFVRYGEVELLSRQQTGLEFLGNVFDKKINIKKLLPQVEERKRRFDSTVSVMENLLNLIVEKVDMRLVNLDNFRHLLDKENLNGTKFDELVDMDLPQYYLQLKHFQLLVGLEPTILALVNRFDNLMRSRTFDASVQEKIKLKAKEDGTDMGEKLDVRSLVLCLAAAVDHWDEKVLSLLSDEATLETARNFFGIIAQNDDESEIRAEIDCFNPQPAEQEWRDFLQRFLFARKMSRNSQVAAAIIRVMEKFQLNHNIESLKRAVRVGEASVAVPLRTVKLTEMSQFDYLDKASKESRFLPLMDAIECSYELCMWLRSNVPSVKEAKTFFDLAMVYLGDSGDLEQKKIETFYTVVAELGNIVYGLGGSARREKSINEFLQDCQEIFQKLNLKPSLIKDLKETSQRLDWIKIIKENQGSVEKSTLKSIEKILQCGSIEIGCYVTNEENFQLRIHSTDAGVQQVQLFPTVFKLEDVKDLQSKLMLIAGQTYENQALLDRFVRLTTSMFRLVDVYGEFKQQCCILCEHMFMRFNLFTRADANAIIELRLSNQERTLSYRYFDVTRGLKDFSHAFSDCLEEWKEEVAQARRLHYNLNFFSLKQILILQRELAHLFRVTGTVSQSVLNLLGYVCPDCSEDDVRRAIQETKQSDKKEKKQPAPKSNPPARQKDTNESNGPVDTAFKQIWNEYLNTTSSDLSNFEKVAQFLNSIGNYRRVGKTISGEFKSKFNENKIFAVSLEPSEQLLVLLELFYLAYQCLPQYEEVLICSKDTSEEEINVFLHRAILSQSPDHLFVIMSADQLTYDLSVIAEQKLSLLLNSVDGRIQSYFFALFPLQSQKQYPFCNALSPFQKDLPTKPSQKKIINWVVQFMRREAGPAHSSFLWITSDRSGMGKSHQCNEIAKVRPRHEAHVFSCSDSHLDVDKLYDFFAKADNKDRRPQTFHLDIAREVQTGFENAFTQLAMFGAITDSSGRIWRRRREDLYLLEHSRNYLFKTEFFVLRYLPSITCVSPSDALRQLEAGEMASDWQPLISDSRLQSAVCKRPAVYLASLGNRNAAHCDLEAQIPSIEIVRLLLENCGIDNPSWLELNNFARFFNGQLVDFERSPFCGPLAEQDLPGFRRFVLSCLLLMSKDFSSRSLNIADESEAAQPNAENDRPLIENFEVRRRWEHTSHPYLLFNQDGTTFTFVGFTVSQQGNLLDSATNAVVQEGIMSPQLYQSLIAQRVRLQERFEDLSRQNKIERMRMVFGHSDTNFPDPDPSYELTMDNVKKMLAIYMRFRSEIPVVLMGETGCGKTKLVEFLARIMLPAQSDICNMRILKVHGAVTTADVVKAVQDAVELSRQNHAVTPYTILFFDEVNTTSAVGLIKEIMIDGRINGERISFAYGLRCIAACNPYRKHPESTIKRLENSGLGYRVRKEDTQDKFGNVPMRHLVYRVKPLPLSLISVLWDFGSLSDDSERKYITRMVESRLRTSPAQKARLVELVAASQHFMRNTDDETKYVSLREVEKVIVVFQWLSNGLLAQLDARDDGDSDCNEETLIEIMPLASCYLSRLPKENKNDYLELLSRVLNAGLSPHDIMQIITRCHQRLLNDISEYLPKSIAKNEALRENVFMMVLCITLRIPLFVVGKPGSSKSLGKSIVKSNMLGTNSQGEIFRQLPNTQMLSFQCSPWSTSEGIIKTFEQCSQLQKEKDLDKFVSVVILDEVGLAEDSPKMPLKALHPLLEEGYFTDSLQTAQNRKHSKVGFIGISNWALDPAKMNRGLYLLRDVPTHEDLLDTAKGICQSQVRRDRVRSHLEHVTTFYEEIYDHTQKEREFFGLRDYFSLVKHLASKSTLNLRTVAQCIKRNFSGFGDLDPVDFFAKEIVGREIDLGNYSAIRDALRSTGEEQRYLLLITENYSGLKILPRLLEDEDHDQQVSIIFGSSFPKDQDYSKICLDINRIKICMERGSTVVLLNMDALYESLYDVLNQYYEQCGDDRFVDLGLGTHRLKCKVNLNFRMIVVAEQTTVRERFPIPLINRLEKHKLTALAMLSNEQRLCATRLSKWTSKFISKTSLSPEKNPSGAFVGFHTDVISTLIIDFGVDELNIKNCLLAVATMDSLVRLDQTELKQYKEEYLEIYYNVFNLSSLLSFLESSVLIRNPAKSFFQVTTHDRLMTISECETLQRHINKEVKFENLSTFQSENEFSEYAKRFFTESDCSILILQFEGLRQNYQNLLACTKYLIEDHFKQALAASPDHCRNKRVVLLIKLVRSHVSPFTGFDSGRWQSVHIEELVPSGRVNIRLLDGKSVATAVNASLEAQEKLCHYSSQEYAHLLGERINTPIDLKMLIDESIHQAMSLLKDGQVGNIDEQDCRLLDRQLILNDALKDRTFTKCMYKFIVNVLTWKDESSVATYSPSEWLSREAAQDQRVTDAGTFIESTWRVLKQKVAPAIACFLAFSDRDQNLNCYRRDGLRGLWLRMVEPSSGLDQITENLVKGTTGDFQRIEVASSSCDGRRFACRFPFSWAVVERLERICNKEQQREAERLMELFLNSTPIGQVLQDEEAIPDLVGGFCHDLVRIRIAGVTEEMLQVLVPVMLRGLSGRAETCLGAAVFESFWLFKEFSQQMTLVTRLMKKVPGLALQVDRIDRLEELPEALFDAFYEYFETNKRDLNTAEKRAVWLNRVERAQSVIDSLLSNFGKPAMDSHWQRIVCVYLFLKNVTAPFDASQENGESSIKPIQLWTSLGKNPSANFSDVSGLRLVEDFLNKMKEDLTVKLLGANACSTCEIASDQLLRLPCGHPLCRNCHANLQNASAGNTCTHCQAPFDPSAIIVNPRVAALDQFKARCNAFLMELVTKLCFRRGGKGGQPPTSDLCDRLLGYVTRSGRHDVAAVACFDVESNNGDDGEEGRSPVFRSFILQQLLAYKEEQVLGQLDEHLRAANHIIDSPDHLALIVVHCLEDLSISRLAGHPIEQRLLRAVSQVVGTEPPSITPHDANPLDLRRLRQVADWRVALSLLASSIAALPDGARSVDLPPLQDGRRRERLARSLLQHQWSRVYFLRCLSRFGGTCAALERLRADEYLARVFREEMQLIEGQVELPDILLCHSELYRNVRRCLYQAYLTAELNQQRPDFPPAESLVVALVALVAAYRLRHMQGRCDEQQLTACINLMLSWMTPAAQELYRRLEPLAGATDGNHQLCLLQIHLAFVLATCQSDIVNFLTQLPNNFNNWLLPGMRHDELFEAFTAQGIGGTRAYACPNGHPYYIANCGQAMQLSRCPDCGSAIGGQSHQLVAGNTDYQAADRTQRGFVPVADQNRPEPVRQLSAGAAALLRSLQALALLLGGAAGGDRRRFAEEFHTGLALFSRATGRSQEDAAQALHLLLLRGLSAPAPATAFNLLNNDGRREFETRLETRLLRPLLDNLSDWLQESNRIVGQDDLGRTSEIVRLVQETSELDRRQAHEGQLWRYRQVISVEHAVQTFRELGVEEQRRHALIEAVTRWEFALRHLRSLPALLQLVKDLVAAWKLNLSMDKAKQQLLRVVGRNERWEAGIREFVETWRALSGYLATRGARFPDAIFPITLHAHPADEMRLAALLPHNGVWGRCIVGLVQLLMEAQNAVLDASGVHCDEIDICQADAASMISYDPDSDLLPALLANSAYSLRPGRGCQVAYNFAGLQQQLAELLVRGRLRLTGHLPQMLYKEEFNLMEQFLLLDQAVPQCRSPSSSMVSHALSSELPSSPPVITSLLEELLPPAVSFLTSLAPKEPSQLLHDFMTKSLRMPQGLPEPLNRCVTIDHVRLLWLSLDRLRCQQLADDGFEPFRDCRGLEAAPLEEPLRELLPPRDLRNRRSLLLEKLHSLMRLELASRPDLLDLPLSEVGIVYTDYDGVFDGWDERLLCKHSAAIWMAVFALEGSRA